MKIQGFIIASATTRYHFGQRAPVIKRFVLLFALMIGARLLSQQASSPEQIEFVCPMDKDVRSAGPGVCPLCGMKLVAGIPDAREFRVLLERHPGSLILRVQDPDSGKPVRDFEIMHEKLYHLFVVSQDLGFFQHIHPEAQPDGSFTVPLQFPHPGMYRILSDFYPKGATPQLIANTVIIPGTGFPLAVANPAPDVAPK